MTTLVVSYAGTKNARFDRAYYRTHHLPLVKKTWGPHGMETISVFYPEDDDGEAGPDTGIIAVCLCEFSDDAALHAALTLPATRAVMDDLPHFTELKATQHVLSSTQASKDAR